MIGTVAVCVHDGFYGCGTGAGRSNRAFLDALIRYLASEVELLVMPVRLAESSNEYDPFWHADIRKMLDRANTRVVPIDNGTDGLTRWGGGLTSFRVLVANAARALSTELSHTSRRLIIAKDVPFFGLAPLLPRPLVRDLVLVPHSTAGIHQADDRERIAWESYSLAAGAARGARIGVISDYMRHHLARDYGVPEPAFIDLPDGLLPEDSARIPPPDSALPEPAREGFWLAMGRAEPYKGFDDLLDALVLLREHTPRPPHLILAAVSNQPERCQYQHHLAERIHQHQPDATLITRFTTDVADLLAHHALRGVIVPSRVEPFGRVPIEAFAAGAAPVIATTAGGLAEQVINGVTGLTAAPSNPADLAAALARATRLTAAQVQRMREAGRRVAAQRGPSDQAVIDMLRTSGLIS